MALFVILTGGRVALGYVFLEGEGDLVDRVWQLRGVVVDVGDGDHHLPGVVGAEGEEGEDPGVPRDKVQPEYFQFY